MDTNDLELNLIERIGIDKLQLSNFALADIDILKLSQMEQVEIKQSTNQSKLYKRHMPYTNAGITKIIVKDNQIFSDLIIGCTNDSNGIPIEYIYLTINVANAKGYNLENMSYIEYDEYIKCVLDYIESEYGIILLNDYMKVNYIEINANIFLEQEFHNYNRVLKLLMSFFNKHLGKLSIYENFKCKEGTQAESYKRGNKSKEIIFYDKSQQIEDMKIPLDKNLSILRMELRLKDKKIIKSAFKSNFWKDINNKKIIEYFDKEILTQLLKKFETWQETRTKELKKMIVSFRKESTKNWHHLLMQDIRNKSELLMIPYILDIEQVCYSFRELPDPNRNNSRSIKSLLNISIESDVYKNNDINKVFEIFNALESYSKMI